MPLRNLSGHRWLRAIRNSLVLLLPVIFVGALALIVGSFPFAALHPLFDQVIGSEWPRLAMLVSNASNGILALCLVVLVSYYLAVEAREKQTLEISPPVVATIALVNFFIFIQLSGAGANPWMLGPRSVLTAILIAIASAELFVLCSRLKFLSFGQKTYDLDPSLHLAVRAISPAIATVAAIFLIGQAISLLPQDFSLFLCKGLRSLDDLFGSQLPGLLVFGLLQQLFWFVGIHGANMLESLYPVSQTYACGAVPPMDISRTFFALYVNIGGSGSTLGLLLAVLLCERQQETKRLAKYALGPSIFNINELVIFGLPIIFNPVYFIPFLLAPLLQIVLAYLCLSYGFIALDVTAVPWTTPALLAGTLNSGSWHGGLLQLFCILLSALIYAPFVRLAEKKRKAEGIDHVRRILADIETIRLPQRSILNRHDDIGHTARKLLHEFMQDIGSQQVYLAYQPQHDRHGAVVGVEALLRWQHHHFGPVPPSIICALAEESRQIIPLGRWVIETACRQLRIWKEEGIENLRMSVNLSPLQLQDPGLLTFIENCLQANKLSAAELALEVTESQHVPEDLLSNQTLKGLHALGVHLEMDDFGMGYSSMLYIRRFRFNAIKLDGSLTREVLHDKHCGEIISSVVQLGRALRMRIVAEYVETREQQVLLEALGCDAFQGYLYSPALIAADCLDYLHRYRNADAYADELLGDDAPATA